MVKFSPSLWVAITVALGGFVFGFDAAVISGVIGFVSNEFNLTPWQQGIVVSIPTLAAAIATLIAGPCADTFGRKKILIIIASLYVFSALFSAFATSFYMLVAARFVGGLAFSSLVIAPLYIAEISQPDERGKMISVNQFNIVIGLSAAYFSNYFLLGLIDGENVWRWMLGLEMLPALIFLLLLFTIPESPRWLALNGKVAEAKVVFERLMPNQSSEQLIESIGTTKKDRQTLSPLYRLKLLFAPNMRKIIVIGLIVGIAQQITGVNAIYFYAPSIFEQSGVGQDAAFSQAVWVGIINIVFTLVSISLIDKLGRKPLLIAGLIGVVLSMSLASFGFSQAKYQLTQSAIERVEVDSSSTLVQNLKPIMGKVFNDDVEFKQALKQQLGEQLSRQHQSRLIEVSASMNTVLILVAILGFVASFAVSLGPVMWVLLAEIFPNHIRGFGIALIGFINSAVSFTVQLVFPWELANLGTAITFMLYGMFALISLVLVYWLLPETKGYSLEQIERKLIDGPAT